MHCPIDPVIPVTCDQSSHRVGDVAGVVGNDCMAEVAECPQAGSARYSSSPPSLLFYFSWFIRVDQFWISPFCDSYASNAVVSVKL